MRKYLRGCGGIAPVKGEHAERNEDRRDERSEKAGDIMRAGLFKHLAVGHDGAGQVGEVALAEERQRQHAQPLREGQAALSALFICCEIGIIILEPCGDENEREADGAAAHIERRSSGRSAAHQIADEIIEHTRRQHSRKNFSLFSKLVSRIWQQHSY